MRCFRGAFILVALSIPFVPAPVAAEPAADYVAVFDGPGWGECSGPPLSSSCRTGTVGPSTCVLVDRSDPTWSGGWCDVDLTGSTSGVRVEPGCVMTGEGHVYVNWGRTPSESAWTVRSVALRAVAATMAVTGDGVTAAMTPGCGNTRVTDDWRGEVVL